MGDFSLKIGQLDEVELVLLRTDVVYYFEVDLLQDHVQLVQDLLLDFVENVLAH